MRRVVVFILMAVATALVVRRMADKVRPAMEERCSEMMNHMPDSSPPKRMMSDLKELKEQTERILGLLEEREKTAESPA